MFYRARRLYLPIILLLFFGFISYQVANAIAWQSKVDVALLEDNSAEIEFFVLLNQQADLSAAASITDKTAKTTYVYETLTQHAAATQSDLIASLGGMAIDYRSYWVSNIVWVKGTQQTIEAVAKRPDVQRLMANVQGETPDLIPSNARSNAPNGIEWNIERLNVPQVWDKGITGEGAVVAVLDTGVSWTHPGLIHSYRGWDERCDPEMLPCNFVDHDYNWFDAVKVDRESFCENDSPQPCDDQGHGSTTIGTFIGNDGDRNASNWPRNAENGVGVAPGAEWITCRNSANQYYRADLYLTCLQWVLAPSRVDGGNPDPAKAPHIVNNSWLCDAEDGCGDPLIFQNAANNIRAAGILMVAAGGNPGSGCSELKYPPGIYDSVFTAGATDNNDQIAWFSARGPVTVDGSDRLKPDVTAPGQDIRSTYVGTGYFMSSGTSFSSPQIAGIAALLISAESSLAGNVDKLEQIIIDTAAPTTFDQDCGPFPGDQVPNAVYGHGRADALAAVEADLRGEPNRPFKQYLPTMEK